MRASTLLLAASAFAVSAGAAFAAPRPAPRDMALHATAMEPVVARSAITGAVASEPTIFGHPASQSTYMFSGRTISVYGHDVDAVR